MRLSIAFLFMGVLCSSVDAAERELTAEDYAADARSIEQLVNKNYGYLERLPQSKYVFTDRLRSEAGAVKDGATLVRFAERAVALLADHHAITGSSRRDSWAVFPSFGDLWIERRGTGFVITAVRDSSPAQEAAIRAGDELTGIDGIPTGHAVAEFWADLGSSGGGERDAYAARILAAGRRDRPRRLTIAGTEVSRTIDLPNLYSQLAVERPPVSLSLDGPRAIIRLNDSLGNDATIAAFDNAMAKVLSANALVIDLTDTPGGGNTVVARAILGWFVDRPTPYQVHRHIAEERATGIPRQWVEQVLPRAGKHWGGSRPTIRVGRWTGSMGEGLAIAFDSFGARVEGEPMAGLLGAIYDYRLERSGQIIKLPAERLMAVSGLPRELFRPHPIDPAR